MTYAAILNDLYGRTTLGIKLGLEATEQLLNALGNPHRDFPSVHIAGTNGKGSTASLLANMLQAAGHKVGLFTSPHLLRFTERIRINGQEIFQSRVDEHYRHIREAESACESPPTFFECATAMAFLEFSQQEVDIAVVEVGLGGRLDATNVLEKELAVITPISFDHQRLLGNSLQQIAREKAGIIPKNGSVVISPQPPEVQSVLEATAQQVQAQLIEADTIQSSNSPFKPRWWWNSVATAKTAAEYLHTNGYHCPPNTIMQGTKDTTWRGRYEWIDDILVDCAHNEAGLAALVETLKHDPKAKDRPVHLVTTLLNDKTPEILQPVMQYAATVQFSPVTSRRGRSLAELGEFGEACTLDRALAEAQKRSRAELGCVVVCGSIFLVADALANLTGEPRDPPVDG